MQKKLGFKLAIEGNMGIAQGLRRGWEGGGFIFIFIYMGSKIERYNNKERILELRMGGELRLGSVGLIEGALIFLFSPSKPFFFWNDE